MIKKVYTVTVKSVLSVNIVSSQSTDDMEQAARFTASLASDVESAMRKYGYGRVHSLDINISVKEIDEDSIPEHSGKWFWCTLNGEPDYDVVDIPSGEDPVSADEYPLTLDLASPLLAYKVEGKLFEHWFEVVDYCKNKLGK